MSKGAEYQLGEDQMNLKSSMRGAVLGAAIFGGAAAANAAVIDFTSASTGASGSVGGGVTWTMTSSSYLNNAQLFDGNAVPTGTGLSFERDGYGVGVGDDEITSTLGSQEWIDVTFSEAVQINAFYFLDLFKSRDGSSIEVGQATVDGTQVFSLAATDVAGSGAAGFVAATFAPIWATVVRFTVLTSNDGLGLADGALAGIGLAAVPVPAAGMMLLGGLGGLAALRRRRKA